VTLVVNAGFIVTASPSQRTIERGDTEPYTVTITRLGGFTGTVNLSLSGLGSNGTGTFSPASVSGTTSTLNVRVNSNASTGTRTLTIRGTSGSLVDDTTVSLRIVY
jgi:hypothetical protein